MSPSQKDDDGQEWEKKPRALDFDTMYWEISNGLRPIAECEEEEDADRILADHRDAQQLREQVEQERHYKRQANQQAASLAVEKIALEERVRVLEEVLREALPYMQMHGPMDNWECEHGFPLDECPNADCEDRAELELIHHIEALLLSPAAATEGGEGA